VNSIIPLQDNAISIPLSPNSDRVRIRKRIPWLAFHYLHLLEHLHYGGILHYADSWSPTPDSWVRELRFGVNRWRSLEEACRRGRGSPVGWQPSLMCIIQVVAHATHAGHSRVLGRSFPGPRVLRCQDAKCPLAGARWKQKAAEIKLKWNACKVPRRQREKREIWQQLYGLRPFDTEKNEGYSKMRL